MSQSPPSNAKFASSYFTVFAAVYSVTIPLITPVVWFAILDISNGQVLRASTTASCLLATSLVAALASIVHRQSRWRYFWIAWVGLALSLVLGYLSLVFRSMPGC